MLSNYMSSQITSLNNMLIDICCKCQMNDPMSDMIWFEILHWVGKGPKHDRITYNTMLDVPFRNKELLILEKIHKKMIIAGITPNIVAHHAMIDGFLTDKCIEEAVDLFQYSCLKKIIEGWDLFITIYLSRWSIQKALGIITSC